MNKGSESEDTITTSGSDNCSESGGTTKSPSPRMVHTLGLDITKNPTFKKYNDDENRVFSLIFSICEKTVR